MYKAIRSALVRYTAVPALVAAGTLLSIAPANAAIGISVRPNATVTADGGTVGVSVTFSCGGDADRANVIVDVKQGATAGTGRATEIPCSGASRTITVDVPAPAGGTWTRSTADVTARVVDSQISRRTTFATIRIA